MSSKLFFVFSFILLGLDTSAFAGSQGTFSFNGYLTSGGIPISSGSQSVVFTIWATKGANSCALYSETQTVVFSAAAPGDFSVQIGNGTSPIFYGPYASLNQIFDLTNSAIVGSPSASCTLPIPGNSPSTSWSIDVNVAGNDLGQVPMNAAPIAQSSLNSLTATSANGLGGFVLPTLTGAGYLYFSSGVWTLNNPSFFSTSGGTITGSVTVSGSETISSGLSVTGLTNINSSASAGATSIGTGAGAGAVTIGNTTGGTTIYFSNGSSMSAAPTTLTWSTVATAAVAALVNQGIILSGSTAQTVSLPSVCSAGNQIMIVGAGNLPWSVSGSNMLSRRGVNFSASITPNFQSSYFKNDSLTLTCNQTSQWQMTAASTNSIMEVCAASAVTYGPGFNGAYQAPEGCHTITVKVWGAGGGGGYASSVGSGGNGGPGGFSSANLSIVGGQLFMVKAGSGGSAGNSSMCMASSGNYNNSDGGLAGASCAGGGGGSSSFYLMGSSTPIIVAAGGGGGGNGNSPQQNGGAGGGYTSLGTAGVGSGGGGSAALAAGGVGGSGSISGTPGSSGYGGSGALNGSMGAGGGGGGGYYGGGGGAASSTNPLGSGGGGGSGYINTASPVYISGSAMGLVSGAPPVAPNTGDTNYVPSAGAGGPGGTSMPSPTAASSGYPGEIAIVIVN